MAVDDEEELIGLVPRNGDSLLPEVFDEEDDEDGAGRQDFQKPSYHRATSTVTVVAAKTLAWQGIRVTAKEEKTKASAESPPTAKPLLNDVFGIAEPGEIVAIMGSSGAGKTTLLNVLTQRNLAGLNVRGGVTINGRKVTRNELRNVVAYVQQDDVFVGSLTVREHLQFHAMMRLGRRCSSREQDRRVRLVLEELGLAKSANTIIGTRSVRGISGGEKKRLAFAAEILTSPPILICDEPTSGLDSYLAAQVVTVLRNLAQRKGMTVLFTIHQPSSQVFALFDKLYLLADGRVAFLGDRIAAARQWAALGKPSPPKFNPADHYISSLALNLPADIASSSSRHALSQRRVEVQRICDYYEKSEIGKATAAEAAKHVGQRKERRPPASDSSSVKSDSSFDDLKTQSLGTYQSTISQQLRWLAWRDSTMLRREPTLLKVQVIQVVTIAILTGLVYWQTPVSAATTTTLNGSLFQLVCNMSFMFQFAVVHHFCGEFHVLAREHHDGLYRVGAYFLAKNLLEAPLYALHSTLFSTILYWMSGLPIAIDSFLFYVLVSVLVTQCAISIGYAMACIFIKLPIAQICLSVFVIPLLAFSGFYINQASLPVYFYPIKYLSHFNYAFEALAVNEWTRIDEIPGCTNTTQLGACPSTGAEVLDNLSFDAGRKWSDVLALIVFILFVRSLAYAALKWRTRRSA